METHNREYKQQLTDSLEKEVVAFLNYRTGGKIFFGFNDEGKATGLANADSDALKIKDRLKHNISPSILGLFDIIVNLENNTIELIIASGSEKPYYISKYGMSSKGCYLRIGTSAEPMSKPMIEQTFARRTRTSLRKIKSPKNGLTFAKLKIYYEENATPLTEKFAHNLELLTDEGEYNYNAYLLSDINITSVRFAKYATNDRTQLISSDEYGHTCIITATQKVLDRLDVENKTHSVVVRDRVDTRIWHNEALREAVRNAFVHNDYTLEVCPAFEIFPNRIEITSAGGLPIDMKSEADFFEGYSLPRNKALMRVFKDVGLVEHLGTGIPKILAHYDQSCFRFTTNFLRISLPKNMMVEESIKTGTEEGGKRGGKTGGKTGGKRGGKSIENVVGFKQLTPKQKELLNLIIENNKITYDKMRETMNIISNSTVQKHINGLKKAGSISREKDYGGEWIIHYKN